MQCGHREPHFRAEWLFLMAIDGRQHRKCGMGQMRGKELCWPAQSCIDLERVNPTREGGYISDKKELASGNGPGLVIGKSWEDTCNENR